MSFVQGIDEQHPIVIEAGAGDDAKLNIAKQRPVPEIF